MSKRLHSNRLKTLAEVITGNGNESKGKKVKIFELKIDFSHSSLNELIIA